MTREGLTEKLLDIKREKGWTWKYICEQIGGMSPILITGAILGQMKLTKPQAANAAKLFGLSKSEQMLLNEVPFRGTGTPMPPTDPLIYRTEGGISRQLLPRGFRADFLAPPPTMTCGPISAILFTPVRAMVTDSSFLRMLIACATPDLPAAPSPQV
jgi:hypothetical protein